MIFKGGDYYDGDWAEGKKYGQGFEMYRNGDNYTGQFVADLFHGQGEFKWADG